MTRRGRCVGRVVIGAATVLVAGAITLTAIRWLAPPGSQPGGEQPTSSSVQRSPRASGATNLDPTGILLVGVGERVQAGPTTEAPAQAFDLALRYAQNNPRDLGYPWLDPSTGELVLSAATGQGRLILETVTFAVPHRIRDVAHSYAELQQIQDDVTRLLAAGVTDAQLIYRTYPDQRDNRTLITISRMSRPLLEELARRFGADAIAIQVAPN